MIRKEEHDYVLGTNEDEIKRLGLQHEVWRKAVQECWKTAGIKEGSKIIDIGAGPGYATIDLAEIAGNTGEVAAIERSNHFVNYIRANCKARQLNVKVYEKDLMTDDLEIENFDFSWCRWVTSFVSTPEILVDKIYKSLKAEGIAIFHEYADYTSWRFAPPSKIMEAYVKEVIDSWHANGGEPDIAMQLIKILNEKGFKILNTKPLVYSIKPSDRMWQWPASFIDNYLKRLKETGRVDSKWTDNVNKAFEELSSEPESIMITPMVLEIIAKKSK